MTSRADKFLSARCVASFTETLSLSRARQSQQQKMIIDGDCEVFSSLLDRDGDVMTSPVHLLSFYCSSPAGSPLSDSDQSWSSAGSPQNCANGNKKQININFKYLINRAEAVLPA